MNLSARNSLLASVVIVLSACGGGGGGNTGGGSGGNGGSSGGNCAPFCSTAGGSGGSTGGGTGGSTGGGSGGSTGGGTAGSGTGGGTAGSGTGGGTAGSGTGGGNGSADAGQIAVAKRANFGTLVQLRNVVVTAVESQFVGDAGDSQANFWVAEPTNLTNGMYIFKNFSDQINTTTDGGVSVGDVVNIDGYLGSLFNNFASGEAYRYELKNSGGNPLRVAVTSHGAAPADVEAPNPFGVNPDGGPQRGYFINDQQRAAFGGARVHIPGPLTLSNADPVPFIRVNDVPGGIVFGFQVSGATIPSGVLVRNSLVHGALPDGGFLCDYRQAASDGGKTVSFPNGIRGVWDTFAQSPCYSGAPTCPTSGGTTRDSGYVPGVGSAFIYVLEPMSCADLAPATVTP